MANKVGLTRWPDILSDHLFELLPRSKFGVGCNGSICDGDPLLAFVRRFASEITGELVLVVICVLLGSVRQKRGIRERSLE